MQQEWILLMMKLLFFKKYGCSKVNFGIESWYRADSKYSIEKGETDRHLIDGINSCKNIT